MKSRLLTIPLLATALLVGAWGCAKKDDPAPATIVGTGSYKLNGRTVTCYARASVLNNSTNTLLQIYLTDTPARQSNTQTLSFFFQKPLGQPTSAYQSMGEIGYSATSTSPNDFFTLQAPSPTETSGGGFSGTFSGTNLGPVQGAITDGVFTDARP
jgi:hypothetical protein